MARTARAVGDYEEMKRMTDHKVGTRAEWLAARLEAEKGLTRRSDDLGCCGCGSGS